MYVRNKVTLKKTRGCKFFFNIIIFYFSNIVNEIEIIEILHGLKYVENNRQ
jgi:hypothetical protein